MWRTKANYRRPCRTKNRLRHRRSLPQHRSLRYRRARSRGKKDRVSGRACSPCSVDRPRRKRRKGKNAVLTGDRHETSQTSAGEADRRNVARAKHNAQAKVAARNAPGNRQKSVPKPVVRKTRIASERARKPMNGPSRKVKLPRNRGPKNVKTVAVTVARQAANEEVVVADAGVVPPTRPV